MNPWDKFDKDDQTDLLHIAEQILNDELPWNEGVRLICAIHLSYPNDHWFGCDDEDLWELQAIADDISEMDLGEAHLWHPDLFAQKKSRRDSILKDSPARVKAIATEMVATLKEFPDRESVIK